MHVFKTTIFSLPSFLILFLQCRINSRLYVFMLIIKQLYFFCRRVSYSLHYFYGHRRDPFDVTGVCHRSEISDDCGKCMEVYSPNIVWSWPRVTGRLAVSLCILCCCNCVVLLLLFCLHARRFTLED